MISAGVPGLIEELNTLKEVNSDKVYLQEMVYYLEDDIADLKRERKQLIKRKLNVQFLLIMGIIGWSLVLILGLYIKSHSG